MTGLTSANPAPLPSPYVRNWLWWILHVIAAPLVAIWFRFRARGLERLPQEGALLLINHQSYLDPILAAVALRRPVSYLARDDLFRIPLVGWIMRNTYALPIRREAAGSDSIRELVRRLQHGFYVGIFPEGTRSTDGRLGPLKPGFQLICRRAAVPIVPVGIAGAIRAMPKGSWWIRPVRIAVVYGEPISPETLAKLLERGREAELMQTVAAAMQQALNEAEARLQGEPVKSD